MAQEFEIKKKKEFEIGSNKSTQVGLVGLLSG